MKKQSLIMVVLLFVSIVTNAQWTQIGSDIEGIQSNDWFGHSVSISADGSLVAIGAPQSPPVGSSAGYVQVYKNSIGNWVQYGNNIFGETLSDWSGESVSLSADGLVIAIGATQNSANGQQSGHVRVYRDSSGVWVQYGDDIDGEAANNYFGISVSINKNGSMLAIGAYLNNGNGTNAGHVRVYHNIAGSWIQMGQDIDGEAAGDFSGASVSLSSDSAIVAIGAPKNSDNGINAGHVRIYKYTGGIWTQIGNDIDGEAAEDWSGGSVSLSDNGSVIAIGAIANDGNGTDAGHVRIYKNISGTWTQIGNDIDGEAAGDNSGLSISLSADGTIVAIGAPYNDSNGNDAGHVRVYQNMAGNWIQMGSDIDGDTALDFFGWSVSLSSDGLSMAVGADGNDANGYDAGQVKLYTYNNVGINENLTNLEQIYPNPNKGVFVVENIEDYSYIQITTIIGDEVFSKEINTSSIEIDIATLPKGIYLLHCIAKEQRITQKIIIQ
jgi:hypothetical protein